MAHNIDSPIVGNPGAPRVIRMHADDNVAIVANDFGLPAGAQLPLGPTLRERLPQGHKVALIDLAEGTPVRRYNVVIGYAAQVLPAGSWVNEQRLVMPTPRHSKGCRSRPRMHRSRLPSRAIGLRATAIVMGRWGLAICSP
jgi:galactarate dehydratase